MLRAFKLLGVIRRASPESRWRLIEAGFFLLAARFLLACLSFDRLMPWCSRRVAVPEMTGSIRRRQCKEVRAAILRVAPHLPGKTRCFPRSMAAQMMLRRRRIGTVLYYGAAALPEDRLLAHVWLQDGETGVIGYRAAGQYRVLARYPAS